MNHYRNTSLNLWNRSTEVLCMYWGYILIIYNINVSFSEMNIMFIAILVVII